MKIQILDKEVIEIPIEDIGDGYDFGYGQGTGNGGGYRTGFGYGQGDGDGNQPFIINSWVF